jgi:hypothetical protein
MKMFSMRCKSMKMNIDIDIERVGKGLFNVYISDNGNSGAEYKNVNCDQIGEYVADLIDCLEESYEV